MSQRKLVHPLDSKLSFCPHPNSPLYHQRCRLHGEDETCEAEDSTELRLHHQTNLWTALELEAHPRWTRDLFYNCEELPESHQCDAICRLFVDGRSEEDTKDGTEMLASINADRAKNEILHEDIYHLHASETWEEHWTKEYTFTLDPALKKYIPPNKRKASDTCINQIAQDYVGMYQAGFFYKFADFLDSLFARENAEDEPRYPISSFGSGFRGFDRFNEKGWERAGYGVQADFTPQRIKQSENRTRREIGMFLALGRMLKIPAGHMVAYDPCYSNVDIVILASLGIHAFKRYDPGLEFSRAINTPTLFYAPGAEQYVIHGALKLTPDIQNVLLLGADAEFCNDIDYFLNSRNMEKCPEYIIPWSKTEVLPIHIDRLQWVPESKLSLFKDELEAITKEKGIPGDIEVTAAVGVKVIDSFLFGYAL